MERFIFLKVSRDGLGLLFSSILGVWGGLGGPLETTFGRLWETLGTLWVPGGSLWGTLGVLGLTLGALRVTLGSLGVPLGSFLRMGVTLCVI